MASHAPTERWRPDPVSGRWLRAIAIGTFLLLGIAVFAHDRRTGARATSPRSNAIRPAPALCVTGC